MDQMSYASMLGGIAISQASTILPHIMGYPLTTHYHIPHGRAGMMLMPAFLQYLEDQSLEISKINSINNVFMSEHGINGFLKRLNIPLRLSDYGIKKIELKGFVEKVIIKDDILITPGCYEKEDIYKIYVNSW
jgi:alcohol dehydrogenase